MLANRHTRLFARNWSPALGEQRLCFVKPPEENLESINQNIEEIRQIQADQRGIQNQIHDLLNGGKASVDDSFANLLTQIIKMSSNIEETGRTAKFAVDLMALVDEANKTDDMQKREQLLRQAEGKLSQISTNLERWKTGMELIVAWDAGGMDPVTFITDIQDSNKFPAVVSKEELDRANDYITKNGLTLAVLNGMPPADARQHRNKILAFFSSVDKFKIGAMKDIKEYKDIEKAGQETVAEQERQIPDIETLSAKMESAQVQVPLALNAAKRLRVYAERDGDDEKVTQLDQVIQRLTDYNVQLPHWYRGQNLLRSWRTNTGSPHELVRWLEANLLGDATAPSMGIAKVRAYLAENNITPEAWQAANFQRNTHIREIEGMLGDLPAIEAYVVQKMADSQNADTHLGRDIGSLQLWQSGGMYPGQMVEWLRDKHSDLIDDSQIAQLESYITREIGDAAAWNALTREQRLEHVRNINQHLVGIKVLLFQMRKKVLEVANDLNTVFEQEKKYYDGPSANNLKRDLHNLYKNKDSLKAGLAEVQAELTKKLEDAQTAGEAEKIAEYTKQLADIEEILNDLSAADEMFRHWNTILETFADWEAGDRSPMSFVLHVIEQSSDYKENGGGKSPQEFFQFVIENPDGRASAEEYRAIYNYLLKHGLQNMTDEEWKALPFNERAEHIESINTAIPSYRESMKEIARRLEILKNALDQARQTLGEEQIDGVHDSGFDLMRLLGKTNIRFYSINQIIQAGKDISGAWKSAYDDWNNLRASSLAQSLNNAINWLPLGRESQATLDRDLENRNDEAKEAYKKLLEQKNVQFNDLRGYLRSNQNDGNRFRAVIEYAADKGQLFDLDAGNRTVFQYFGGFRLEAGTTLPPTWNEATVANYMLELVRMNGDGQSKMTQQGESLVSTEESIPPIQNILIQELERRNYWAAVGILNVAMDKGKTGEVSTWLNTTMLAFIRDDDHARRYFPMEIWDQSGNKLLGHVAFTAAQIKLDRKKLHDWQQTNDPSRFEESGDWAKIMIDVETHLTEVYGSDWVKEKKARDKNPGEREGGFNHIVGLILAAKPYKDEKQPNKPTISIFDNRYEWYRKKLTEYQNQPNVSGSDDDFFFDIGDMMLMGATQYDTIFAMDSLGEFQERAKPLYFLNSLVELHKRLTESGNTVALENFKAATRLRFDVVLGKIKSHGSSPGKWLSRRQPGASETIIEQFTRLGLMSSDIERYLRNDTKEDLDTYREQHGHPDDAGGGDNQPQPRGQQPDANAGFDVQMHGLAG